MHESPIVSQTVSVFYSCSDHNDFIIARYEPQTRLVSAKSGFLLIILVTFVTYIYTFYEYVSYIRKLYIAEYSHKLEENCRSLLTSFQSFGAQQREFQKETHDILNAQFTYHSLLDQGKKDEAERYRLQKQEEWRQKS